RLQPTGVEFINAYTINTGMMINGSETAIQKSLFFLFGLFFFSGLSFFVVHHLVCLFVVNRFFDFLSCFAKDFDFWFFVGSGYDNREADPPTRWQADSHT